MFTKKVDESQRFGLMEQVWEQLSATKMVYEAVFIRSLYIAVVIAFYFSAKKAYIEQKILMRLIIGKLCEGRHGRLRGTTGKRIRVRTRRLDRSHPAC